MNKQELIKRIVKLPYAEGPIADTVTVNREWILKSIEQLDEPQKVKVPQGIANYIEYTQTNEWDLLEAMENVAYEDDKELRKWFNNNSENFALAWLDGYEVKKEDRYIVKIKGIISSPNYLKHNTKSDNWFMGNCEETFPYRTHHTREELEKAGFKWVFFCEGVEVKKVD